MPERSSGEAPHNKSRQEYFFGPWSFSINKALDIIAENPRPSRQLSVDDWANALSLPGLETPNTIPLLGVGPNFDTDYAMTTDLDTPVLIATLVDKEGVASPLFIDGTHRLYRAYSEGVAELPAYVLTPEETLAIRQDRYLD